jgi:FixJ family two-component response regulator
MIKRDKANTSPILSPREKQLLRRLAQGKPDQKIAAEIGGRTDQITLQRKKADREVADTITRTSFDFGTALGSLDTEQGRQTVDGS